ncbi:hypothetical protein B0H13DRAFT_1999602, partial [Mycena leptocephala]
MSDQLEHFLSRAYAVSSGVAGRLVEGLIHRSLSRGFQLPSVFNSGAVAATLELLGNADSSPVPPAAAAKLRRCGRNGRDDAQAVQLLADLPGRHRQQGFWYHAQHHCEATGGGRRSEGLDNVVAACRVQNLVYAARATLTELRRLSKDEKLADKFRGEVGVPIDIDVA